MSDTSATSATPAPSSAASAQGTVDSQVLYRERQWVPWYFWLFAAVIVALTSATAGLNRSMWWTIIPAILLGAIAVWVLITWSSTVIKVERDPDGTRWLTVKDAQLPNDVVSRSITVPKSARRNALGPQFDPAAFLVSHAWVDEHAMMVLNDPEDDTPYWLISSKDPEALLHAFVPEQH